MEINKGNYESWFLDYYEKQLGAGQVAELFLFLESHPDLKSEFESFELLSLPKDELTAYDEKNLLFRKEEALSAKQLLELLGAAVENDLDEVTSIAFNNGLLNFPLIAQSYQALLAAKFNSDDHVTNPDKGFYYKGVLNELTLSAWLIADMEGDLLAEEKNELELFFSTHPQLIAERELFMQAQLLPVAVKFPGKTSLYRRETKVIQFTPLQWWWVAACLLILAGTWKTLHKNEADNRFAVQHKAVAPSTVKDKKLRQALPVSISPQLKETASLPPVIFHQKSQRVHQRNTINKSLWQHTNEYAQRNKSNLPFIESIPFKEYSRLPVEEPFAYAERRLIPALPVDKATTANSISAVAMARKKGDEAVALIDKATGGELSSPDPSGKKLPFGSRMIRVAAWALGQVTDNRLRVKTTFNPLNGSLAACELETANHKWQKEF